MKLVSNLIWGIMKYFYRFVFILACTGILFSHSCNLKPGMKAPGFSLFDQDSLLHSLDEYGGQKVVIYFYPKDNTPGCTKEACSIRDKYTSFSEYNIVTMGISYDSPVSHKKFRKKYNLPFNLLSDSDKNVSKMYCCDGWFFPDRRTILIDENGAVLKIIDNVVVSDHGDQVLQAFGIKENDK